LGGGGRRTKCVFVSVLRTSERDTHRLREMGVGGGGKEGGRERERRIGGEGGTAERHRDGLGFSIQFSFGEGGRRR
jgi:hypothetical protein